MSIPPLAQDVCRVEPKLSPLWNILTEGSVHLGKIVLNKVCLTIFNKRHEYFLTLAKTAKVISSTHPGLAEQITRRVSDTLYFLTSFGRMTFPQEISHTLNTVSLKQMYLNSQTLQRGMCLCCIFPNCKEHRLSAASLCSLPSEEL